MTDSRVHRHGRAQLTPRSAPATAVTVLAALVALAVPAQAASFASGPDSVPLLELYTSEGCSSCPPADRWLSGLQSDPQLWLRFVPIAFHVDYWNGLGWPDRLSTREFSDRQRDYRRAGSLKTVYTPGFLWQGQEWRGWFRGESLPRGPAGMPGELRVHVDDGAARVSFVPHAQPEEGDYVAHVAILGFDLRTRVQRGENVGRELAHDFAVIGLGTAPLLPVGGEHRVTTALPRERERAVRRALAVWITRAGDPRPLQATGGWLD
ncbi:MAG: DUF1223 domain-containing protein [Gammaproteobacteria bacterium]|nr:DUF1223 domain-containing protein [Gammaproteobacteria bacterium]